MLTQNKRRLCDIIILIIIIRIISYNPTDIIIIIFFSAVINVYYIVGKNEFNVPSIKFTVHDDDQNKYTISLRIVFRHNGVCESYAGGAV